MAIYQFKCDHGCGFKTDVIRSISEASEPYFCERCGAQMDRQVELPARVTPGTYGKGGGRK